MVIAARAPYSAGGVLAGTCFIPRLSLLGPSTSARRSTLPAALPASGTSSAKRYPAAGCIYWAASYINATARGARQLVADSANRRLRAHATGRGASGGPPWLPRRDGAEGSRIAAGPPIAKSQTALQGRVTGEGSDVARRPGEPATEPQHTLRISGIEENRDVARRPGKLSPETHHSSRAGGSGSDPDVTQRPLARGERIQPRGKKAESHCCSPAPPTTPPPECESATESPAAPPAIAYRRPEGGEAETGGPALSRGRTAARLLLRTARRGAGRS